MKKIILSIIVLSLLVPAGDVFAEGKISGYMFGDYYYVVRNHHENLRDSNGFWFRRIYFTYDHKWDDTNFSARLRFEMANTGKYESPDKAFNSNKMTEATVKDAYLKWSFFKDHALYAGISSTPTWGSVEKLWGYRSVEKTPLDLYKLGSSKDFGIAVKGKVGKFQYHSMFGNGNSNSSEDDKYKKIFASFGYNIIEGLLLEAYSDFEWHEDDADQFVYQCFASYKTKTFRVGLQYAGHLTKAAKGESDDTLIRVASAYGAYQIIDLLALFARIDKTFDPVGSGEKIAYLPIDKTSEFYFVTFGLDITPFSRLHIIPNLEYIVYEENDAGDVPDYDLFGRVTLYFKF